MPHLILVRHGQSEWNLEKRFTGWVDVELTKRGESEAERAGLLIKEKKLEDILLHHLFGYLQKMKCLYYQHCF